MDIIDITMRIQLNINSNIEYREIAYDLFVESFIYMNNIYYLNYFDDGLLFKSYCLEDITNCYKDFKYYY